MRTLRKALENGKYLVINERRSGGTYVRFLVDVKFISREIKKEWGAAWFRLHLVNDGRRTVELIFSESSFRFLTEILGCDSEKKLTHSMRRVFFFREVEFLGRKFKSEAQKAEPSDEVRRYFANILAEGSYAGSQNILDKNRRYLVWCQYEANSGLAGAASRFKLADFYYEKIGNATSLEEIPWENMKLSQVDIIVADAYSKASDESRQSA